MDPLNILTDFRTPIGSGLALTHIAYTTKSLQSSTKLM